MGDSNYSASNGDEIPIGWHPDPDGSPGAERFWDGKTWAAYTDFPDELDDDATSVARIVVMTLIIAAILATAGWVTWNKYSEHRAEKRTQEVAAWVEQSMREKFRTDTALAQSRLTVERVDLIRVSDTKYEGIAEVRTTRSSKNRQIQIDVTADDERMMWRADPASMLALTQEMSDQSGPWGW